MTIKTIKNIIAKAGYEIEYKTGENGRGWYKRLHGTFNWEFVGTMCQIEADFQDALGLN